MSDGRGVSSTDAHRGERRPAPGGEDGLARDGEPLREEPHLSFAIRARAVTVPGVEPGRVAARSGGVEVYRVEDMELRAGDRIRWTRNDTGLGLVNSQTAEVARVKGDKVTFRLEDGRTLELSAGDPQLRHVDRAWASAVHAFQGRTVDTVIAAMEANHPHLTTQKNFYVEISRARDRAELVTDDRSALREQLEAVTGERIAAL